MTIQNKQDKRAAFFMNGLFLTAVAVCARAVGLVFGAYVSAHIGAQGMGLYTLTMTVYGFALTFATAGISLTVTSLVAAAIGEGREGDIGRLLRASCLYAAAFGACAMVALWLLAPMLAVRVLGDVRLTRALRTLSLSLVPESLGAVFFGYFVGVRRVIGNAVVQIAAQGIKMLLTFGAIASMQTRSAADTCMALAAVSFLTDASAFLLQMLRLLVDRARYSLKNANKTIQIRTHIAAVAAMALPIGLSAYIRSALLTVEHALIPLCLQMRGEGVAQSMASYGLLHAMAVPVLLFPMATLSSFASLLVPEYAQGLAAGQTSRLSRITTRAVRLTLVYACTTAVLMAAFAEEIGFCLYDSYEVGYYLRRMAPVIPIMYLDHVTDSMLKGTGEQVYSMWVNISDACLSVLLVRWLIPRMGIGGYALVIVCMEGYNFLLSFLRLRRRIAFCLRPLSVIAVPTVAAAAAAYITKGLFVMNGASTTPLWLWGQLLFAACVCVALLCLYDVATRLVCHRCGAVGFANCTKK